MSIIVEDMISNKRAQINEAFVGKSYILMEIEKEFGNLRSQNLSIYSQISQHPSVIKINRLFEQQFGMHLFVLKVLQEKDFDAFTRTISSTFDVAHNIDLPSMVTGDMYNGYRWIEGNNLCIMVHISYGILTNKDITDAEVVAIILHEIGHNFADALYDDLDLYNKEITLSYERYLLSYATLMGFINSISTHFKAKKRLKEYNNSYRLQTEEYPKKPSKIAGFFGGVKANINAYKDYKDELARRKKGGYKPNLYKRYSGERARRENRRSFDRQNEVIADKFAGVYGYGVEIVSSLKKIEYTKSRAQKELEAKGGKLAQASREYDDAVKDICDYDCHPNLVQRINAEIKLLEKETEKEDVDPKYKLVIYDQLEQLRSLLNKITKTSKLLSKDENAKNAYHDFVNKECPTAVEEEIENAIETALDKLIEEDRKRRSVV